MTEHHLAAVLEKGLAVVLGVDPEAVLEVEQKGLGTVQMEFVGKNSAQA